MFGVGVGSSLEQVAASDSENNDECKEKHPAVSDFDQSGGCLLCQSVACSYACATCSTDWSPNCGPNICRPTGSPSEKPQGTEIPGSPCNICWNRADVSEIHLERVLHFRSSLKRDRRRRRRNQSIIVAECVCKFADESTSAPAAPSCNRRRSSPMRGHTSRSVCAVSPRHRRTHHA